MKKVVVLTSIVLVVVLIIFQPSEKIRLLRKYYFTPCPHDRPEKQTDFPIYLEDVNLDNYYESLLSYEGQFNFKVLERISYEGEEFPIYEIASKNDSSENKLLVISTTHGNEFATALVIPQLLDDITNNNEYYSGWNIKIIAPANPVGLSYQSRYNEDGCDINRDFGNFHTLGARIQRELIKNFEPDVIVALHESPRDGFFIFAEQTVSRELEMAVIDDLVKEKIELGKKNTLGLPLTTKGLSHKSKFTLWLQELLNISTFGKYATDLGIPTITTESPWNSSNVEGRIKPHIIVIKSVINNFNQ